MEAIDLISEQDASTYCGVSVGTLSRFAEVGYLKIENGASGDRMFSKTELRSLFGIKESPNSQTFISEPSKSRVTPTVVKNFSAQLTQVNQKPTVHQNTIQRSSVPPQEAPSPLRSQVKITKVEEPLTDEPDLQVVQREKPENFSVSENGQHENEPAHIENDDEFEKDEFEDDQVELGSPQISLKELELEQENVRLKNIAELQEKVLEYRESEIKDLKEQRGWLRTRVEKLEEKGERDQFLLMSESRAITKLLENQKQRKSPVKLALEWLGVSPPQATQGNGTTIEVPLSKRSSK